MLLNLWLEMAYIFHASSSSLSSSTNFIATQVLNKTSGPHSPIGRSAQFCSVLLKVHLRDLGGVNRGSHDSCMYCHKDDINVICELLAVKHGDLELDLFGARFWMLY